jgi:hypothetical protein
MSLRDSGVHVMDLHAAMRKARDGRAAPFSKVKVQLGDDGHLMAKTILAALCVEVPDETVATIKADRCSSSSSRNTGCGRPRG